MVQCLGKVMGTAFEDGWGGGRKRPEKTVFIVNTDTRFGLRAPCSLMESCRRKNMSFPFKNVFYKERVQKLLSSLKNSLLVFGDSVWCTPPFIDLCWCSVYGITRYFLKLRTQLGLLPDLPWGCEGTVALAIMAVRSLNFLLLKAGFCLTSQYRALWLSGLGVWLSLKIILSSELRKSSTYLMAFQSYHKPAKFSLPSLALPLRRRELGGKKKKEFMFNYWRYVLLETGKQYKAKQLYLIYIYLNRS